MKKHSQPLQVTINDTIAQSIIDHLSCNVGRLKTLLFDAKYRYNGSEPDNIYIHTLQQSIDTNERNIAVLRAAIQNAYIADALKQQ